MRTMRRLFYLLSVIVALGAFSCRTSMTSEEKAMRAKLDTIAYENVVACLDSMDFIIPAQTVQIRGHRLHFTSSELINFIYAHDGKCAVQLASASNPFPGPNGIGGVTAKGDVRLLSKKIDKKGNAMYEFSVNSLPQSMRIVMTLPYMSTRVQAEVSGNLRGGNVVLTGYVEPYQSGRIAEGQSL